MTKAWVAGLVLVLMGCSISTAPLSESERDDTVAQADRILVAIVGTSEQQNARTYLQNQDLNAGYLACMRDRGHTANLGWLTIWTGWAPDALSDQWMGRLNRKPSAEELIKRADQVRAYEAQQANRAAPGYRDAHRHCIVDGPGGMEPSMTSHSAPGSVRLMTAFNEMVFGVEDQLGSIDSYTRCMTSRGIDYTADVPDAAGYGGLYLHLTGGMPVAPKPGQRPSQKWQDYLAYEDQAMAADAACRADTYYEGLARIAPLLDDFEREHADELARMQTEWDAILAKAERQGMCTAAG